MNAQPLQFQQPAPILRGLSLPLLVEANFYQDGDAVTANLLATALYARAQALSAKPDASSQFLYLACTKAADAVREFGRQSAEMDS